MRAWKAAAYGAAAGLGAAALFLVVHAAWIAPIWHAATIAAPAGAVSGAIGGLAYRAVRPRVAGAGPLRGGLFGAAAAGIFLAPLFAAAALASDLGGLGAVAGALVGLALAVGGALAIVRSGGPRSRTEDFAAAGMTLGACVIPAFLSAPVAIVTIAEGGSAVGAVGMLATLMAGAILAGAVLEALFARAP